MMLIILFFALILFYSLISISIEDIKTMLISEKKLIGLAISGIFYLFFLGFFNEDKNNFNLIFDNSFLMVIVFIIMYSISYISYIFFGVKSLGKGDIKLAAISTIWLGKELIFISLCISFLLSATYSLHGKFFKRLKPFQQYPFAPFMSIGIFCTWVMDKILTFQYL